jgi:hypothetical protein
MIRHRNVLIAQALACAFLLPCACATSAVTVTLNPDGTFTPNPVSIRVGESIQWVGLSRTDAIVQIGDFAQFPNQDPCGIADDALDHAFAAADLNEFTGPSRNAVSGIFALGPNEPGLVQKLSTESCSCETTRPSCVPLEVNALDGNAYKLCPEEGALLGTLDSTWSNPDVTGVIVRINWSDIQVDNRGVIEFHWDDLDRALNKAVASGKLVTLDVRAGKGGTPHWIFTDYEGAAGPGPVVPLVLKDWGSEPAPARNNCGFDFKLGSPVDSQYRDLYVAMLRAMASHVASDSRWFQAVAHVKVSGANLLSSEARLPNRCYDGDLDGALDVVGQDPCLCNSKLWATAGYTPDGLYEYYRVVGHAIYQAFFRKKSLGFQLIQAGFPRVEGPTNFEGDSLLDQQGANLLLPQGETIDDLDGTIQTETILLQGHDGRFTDTFGLLTDLVAGRLFVPQHSGLGRLPNDSDVAFSCSQAVAVDPLTERALFPIAAGTPADRAAACPNRWAVNEGTRSGQIMGFQTANPGNLEGLSGVESALWNLSINSNGVFVELYEQPLWEAQHTRGTGAAAAVLDPSRTSLPAGNPAPFSKNLFSWAEELHDRRKRLVDATNPHLKDPFPPSHRHTFSKPIAAAETYYYIDPSRCSLTNDANRVGQIVITP